MTNWTFVQSLKWETGLDEEMCERILQLVSDSSYFFTLDQWREQLEINEAEVDKAEETIANLEEEIAELRDSIDRVVKILEELK